MSFRFRFLAFLAALLVAPGALAAQDGDLSQSDEASFLLFEGELALDEGKILEAVADFAQVVSLDPDRLEGRLLYAQALTRGLLAGVFEDERSAAETALENYEWVLERNPDHREARAGRRLLTESFLREAPSPLKTERGIEAWSEGQKALTAGDNEAAAGAFARAVRAEPDVAAAHVALGESLRRDGKLKKAATAFGRAVELDPDYAPAYIGLAQVAEKQEDNASALASYARAQNLDPDSPPAATGIVRVLEARGRDALENEEWSLLGRSYLALGKYEQAREAFGESLARAPEMDVDKALGITEFFLDDDEAALQSLTRAHDTDPKDLETLYYLGAAHLRKGNAAVGRGFLESLLDLDPGNPNGQRLLGLSVADDPDRTEDAIRYLLGAHAGGARIKDFSCILGSLYMRARRNYDATLAFEDCLEEDPDFGGAYLGLGIIADDQGQTRDAIRYLDRYLDIEENPDRSAVFRLGVAYLRSGQDKLGFDTLRRVVQANTQEPDSSAALTDLQILEATSFFLATVRRFDDAIFIGEMLLTRDSDNSIYNNNLAMTYADANLKPGRAHTLALKANRLSPDNPGHMDTLAWVLLRLKRYEEAEELFLRSLELSPDESEDNLSEIYYHLGVLYIQTNDYDKARENLMLAAKSPPTPFLRDEIQRRLEQVNSEAEHR